MRLPIFRFPNVIANYFVELITVGVCDSDLHLFKLRIKKNGLDIVFDPFDKGLVVFWLLWILIFYQYFLFLWVRKDEFSDDQTLDLIINEVYLMVYDLILRE